MEIKCRLKIIFAERDIKQNEFAKDVGISRATLSSLVNNKSLPTLQVAYAISERLKLSVEEIWTHKKYREDTNFRADGCWRD